MANGTITGSFTGGTDSSKFTYKLIWTSEIYDVATRKSKVTLSWYVVCSASGYPTHKANTGWTKTVDGTSSSGSQNFNYPNPVNLPKNTNFLYRSEVVYITHGLDGTKTVNISGTINLSGTSAGNGSLSGQMVLDQIEVTPPTATGLTLTDVGTGYSTVGVYVAGFTTMRLTATATAGDAPIASYEFYRGTTLIGRATDMDGTGEVEMAYTEPAGSWVYSVVVYDTGGNSDTYALASVTINAYTPPTISATTFRCNSGGTQDNDGAYGRINMTWAVANVGTNSATVHKCTINGSDYTSFPQTVSGLATTNTYSAVYVVTDSLGSTATITQYVQVSFINFDLYPSSNGGGVAFGEAAQNNKMIVNHSDTILRGNLSVGGNVTLTNALPVAQGGTGQSAVSETALTITAADTTQISSISGSYARYGKIIDVAITFTTAASLSNGSAFLFTISNLPMAKVGIWHRCSILSGTKFVQMYVKNDGSDCGIRNVSGTAVSAGTFNSARFMFIEA